VGITLDRGALIGIERGDPRLQELIRQAGRGDENFAIPAAVLAQVWRGTPRQVLLSRFLRLRNVEIAPLDEGTARAAGVLCGRAGTSDVVDASVVICAGRRKDVVVTSDPDDLRRLDAQVPIAAL
jgi:predicted nucleic acid-binding protein